VRGFKSIYTHPVEAARLWGGRRLLLLLLLLLYLLLSLEGGRRWGQHKVPLDSCPQPRRADLDRARLHKGAAHAAEAPVADRVQDAAERQRDVAEEARDVAHVGLALARHHEGRDTEGPGIVIEGMDECAALGMYVNWIGASKRSNNSPPKDFPRRLGGGMNVKKGNERGGNDD
jgi:hypothetical protein